MPVLNHKLFMAKPEALQRQIHEALDILEAFGIPGDIKKSRGLEKMALVFMAVADVRPGAAWSTAKDVTQGQDLTSRDVIDLLNMHYGEHISRGSYDDIRRKDLVYPVQAGIIVQPASQTASRNDGTRGYGLDPAFAQLVRQFGQASWAAAVAAHLVTVGSLADRLRASRKIPMMPVTLPGGGQLELTPGEHNQLQRQIVEQFLPRFGHGAELLYLGDAANKSLHLDAERLAELGFFKLDHGELPDVVAYAPQDNWLYLIEAVHSSGPISPIRKVKLQNAADGCTADLVFVTAFQDRATFRKFVGDLAWEQEVWIADEPDHMIHFNGDRFMGPH